MPIPQHTIQSDSVLSNSMLHNVTDSLRIDTTKSILENISSSLQENVSFLSTQQLKILGMNLLVDIIPRIVIAIMIIWLGFKIIKALKTTFINLNSKHHTDTSIGKFISSIISMLLKIFVVMSALGVMGIGSASFLALIGVIGFAISLAMQGTLQNFAGGVIIVMFKPFRVGDDIEFSGNRGIVKEIQTFHTILESALLNDVIVIPNSNITSGLLINYSTTRKRITNFTYEISYGEDIDKVRSIIRDIVLSDNRILQDEPIDIVLGEFKNSSITLILKAWVMPGDFFDVKYYLNEKIYNRFNELGIEFPYNQLDVHHHEISRK